MPRFSISLPSGETLPDDFARELVSLLGYNAPDGSNNADDARTIGTALADAYERLDDAGREAFVTLTTELLSEWESRLGLPVSPSLDGDTRRTALTAARRASAGNSIGKMRSALRVLDPVADVVRTRAVDAAAAGAPRAVFRLGIRVSAATLANATSLARVVSLMERMKPAHVGYEITSVESFRTDDPDSLTDVVTDVLGA